MMLNKYNISLELLTLTNLEKLRTWRNSSVVNTYMEFKEKISEQQQMDWFKKIDPKKELYFIIKQANEAIGMTHLKNIDVDLKCGEVGLFIGEQKYMGSGISFGASLLILDVAFLKLKLNEVHAKVHNLNKNAIIYNSFLGFEKYSSLNSDFSQWKLTFETYKNTKLKVAKHII